MRLRIKNRGFNFFYINTNYDLENTILVAGTGRSGTTWLGNIINYRNDYRDMFEPFVSEYTKECQGFHYKQYIRADSHNKHFLETARKILSGNIKNQWVNRYNKKFFCEKRLIKEIRANFFLKWIKNNFPSIPIIFIIRHPCAVAYSRIKLGWRTYLEDIVAQEDLVQDYLVDYIEDIKSAKSDFEQQVYLWCVENYVPLKQFNKGEIYFLFYEHLCLDPPGEIKKLFSWLGKEYNSQVEKTAKTPSEVSTKQSAIVTGESLVNSWKKKITKDQVSNTMRILEKFGFERLYDELPYPKVNGSIFSE